MEKAPGSGLWAAAIRSTRPTAAGRLVLNGGILLLVIAYFTDRTALYCAASLLLALYGVAHLGAAYAGKSLEVAWDCPSRVFAGEPFPLRFVIRNRGLASLTGIEVPGVVPGGDGKGPADLRVDAAVLPLVAPGCAVPLDVGTKLRHRGEYRLAAPRLEVRWPFGLAVAVHACRGEQTVIAYPWRVEVESRAMRSRAPEPARREVAAAVPRGGELLRGVRGWVPGDAPRAIAWRASARHGVLLTREFEREDAGRAVVALDADPRDLPTQRDRAAAVEQACAKAASLLLRLRAEGRRTALAAWTPEPLFLPSISGERALGRALEALALLQPTGRKEPRRDPLALVPEGVLRGARVILVKAAFGPVRTTRRPGGTEVVTLPALRGTFAPERDR
jgi:uncharacterized protein (DUF58 family)